jgi:hypothetical protein
MLAEYRNAQGDRDGTIRLLVKRLAAVLRPVSVTGAWLDRVPLISLAGAVAARILGLAGEGSGHHVDAASVPAVAGRSPWLQCPAQGLGISIWAVGILALHR